MTCICVTPDPSLFPRLPLRGESDDGRLVVHLLPMPGEWADEIRVFAWQATDWPDDQDLPEQTTDNPVVEGDYRIYAGACRSEGGSERDFESVLRVLANLPRSKRWDWLEANGWERKEA